MISTRAKGTAAFSIISDSEIFQLKYLNILFKVKLIGTITVYGETFVVREQPRKILR